MKERTYRFIVALFVLLLGFDVQADELTLPVTNGASIKPAVSAVSHEGRPVEPSKEGVEFELASFELKNLNGELFPAKDFENRKVVLYFWSIYCRSCVGTMRDFEQWRQQLAEQNISLLGVHLFESRVEKVVEVVSQLNVTLPVLLAPTWVRELLSIRVLPTSLVFDKSGKLTDRFDGMSDTEGLKMSLFKEVEKVDPSRSDEP